MPKGGTRSISYEDAQRLHADGLTCPQIAATLHVSLSTVYRALRPERVAYEVAFQRARRERLRQQAGVGSSSPNL